MSLLNKVKEQASHLDRDKVRGMADKVKGKVEDIQGKRKADDLLDDLGRLLYAERTGRPVPGADVEIDRLVTELRTLEDEGVPILA